MSSDGFVVAVGPDGVARVEEFLPGETDEQMYAKLRSAGVRPYTVAAIEDARTLRKARHGVKHPATGRFIKRPEGAAALSLASAWKHLGAVHESLKR